jgi:hypothetical protein
MKDRDREAKQLVIDFKTTFGSESGKRVLAKLRNMSTYDRSSISADKTKKIDIDRLVYDEGQRAVIIYIQKMLGKDPYEEKQKVAIG